MYNIKVIFKKLRNNLISKNMFCNVVVTRPFDQVFTYKLKKGQNVKEGSIVNVPFG